MSTLSQFVELECISVAGLREIVKDSVRYTETYRQAAEAAIPAREEAEKNKPSQSHLRHGRGGIIDDPCFGV